MPRMKSTTATHTRRTNLATLTFTVLVSAITAAIVAGTVAPRPADPHAAVSDSPSRWSWRFPWSWSWSWRWSWDFNVTIGIPTKKSHAKQRRGASS